LNHHPRAPDRLPHSALLERLPRDARLADDRLQSANAKFWVIRNGDRDRCPGKPFLHEYMTATASNFDESVA